MSKVSYQVSSRERIQTQVCLISESECLITKLPGQWRLPSVRSLSLWESNGSIGSFQRKMSHAHSQRAHKAPGVKDPLNSMHTSYSQGKSLWWKGGWCLASIPSSRRPYIAGLESGKRHLPIFSAARVWAWFRFHQLDTITWDLASRWEAEHTFAASAVARGKSSCGSHGFPGVELGVLCSGISFMGIKWQQGGHLFCSGART